MYSIKQFIWNLVLFVVLGLTGGLGTYPPEDGGLLLWKYYPSNMNKGQGK
jgi:hypothetical protein